MIPDRPLMLRCPACGQLAKLDHRFRFAEHGPLRKGPGGRAEPCPASGTVAKAMTAPRPRIGA